MGRRTTTARKRVRERRSEERLDPIPSFYCTYLLRSTVNNKSYYIGSTPDPSRRLAQHNGLVVGGAKRTSRDPLRPWELVLLVSGFTSRIAALQFEWAWQHTKDSRHAGAKGERVAKGGRSIETILFNLSVLCSSGYFSRWPLEMHVFDGDVRLEWQRQCRKPSVQGSFACLRVIYHEGDDAASCAIRSFDTKYRTLQGYLQKSWRLLHRESDDAHGSPQTSGATFDEPPLLSCSVCRGDLASGEENIVVCSHQTCECVSHMTCLASSFLSREDADYQRQIIPTRGHCPRCCNELEWPVLMKELSLRLRGRKIIDKLCKGQASAKPSQDLLNSQDFEFDDDTGSQDDDTDQHISGSTRVRVARQRKPTGFSSATLTGACPVIAEESADPGLFGSPSLSGTAPRLSREDAVSSDEVSVISID